MAGRERAPSNGRAPVGLKHPENVHTGHQVSEIQRTRILAAMAEVCTERGAANVTVAHVVAGAGVSRRTFYELFSDREDCFLAALEEGLACAERYVAPAYRSAGGWRGRIRGSLIGLLSFVEDQPHMGQLLIVETLGAGRRALHRRQQVLGQVVAAVEAGVEQARRGGQPPPLTTEGVVGGVLSVLHARMLDPKHGSILELAGPLMSMIVLPYEGAAAARNELARPAPKRSDAPALGAANPLRDLEMRLTYRTVRVLMSVAARPRSSNREVGAASEIPDQGQASKLLTRLERLGLIENAGASRIRGAPNAWTLTPKGLEIQRALAQETDLARH